MRVGEAGRRICVNIYEGTHCKEDPIYVLPEMKLRGLVPNMTKTPKDSPMTIESHSGNMCFEFLVQLQCLCSVAILFLQLSLQKYRAAKQHRQDLPPYKLLRGRGLPFYTRCIQNQSEKCE